MRQAFLKASVAAFMLICGETIYSQDGVLPAIDSATAQREEALRQQISELSARLEAIEQQTQRPSEEKPMSVSVSLGAARTDLSNAAIRALLEIGKSSEVLQERFISRAVRRGRTGFWYNSAPDVSIETGNGDAFNNIVAKYEGDFAFTRLDRIDGLLEPNIHKPIHLVPFHVGIETNGQFSNVNILTEIGYNPLVQYIVPRNENIGLAGILLRSFQIAAYLQGGYKVLGTGDTAFGGQRDESAEAPNTGLLRIKARAKLAPVLYIDRNGFGIGLKGDGTFWYDFLNKQIYYKVDASVCVLIGGNRSIDFTYQKGSGAPNFNQGDQWSANLNLKF